MSEQSLTSHLIHNTLCQRRDDVYENLSDKFLNHESCICTNLIVIYTCKCVSEVGSY